MNSRARKINSVAVYVSIVVMVFTVVSMTGVLAVTGDGATTDASDDDDMIQKLLDGYNVSAGQISTVEILPGGRYETTILIEDSAATDINEMGFYYPYDITNVSSVSESVTPSSVNGCHALYRIFDGPDRVSSSKVFDTSDDNPATSDNVGLWLNSPNLHRDWHRALGGLYYSQTELNCDNFQHVKIYEIPQPHLYLAFWEDWCGGGDNDYTDMVVMLRPIQTPIERQIELLRKMIEFGEKEGVNEEVIEHLNNTIDAIDKGDVEGAISEIETAVDILSKTVTLKAKWPNFWGLAGCYSGCSGGFRDYMLCVDDCARASGIWG